MLYGLQKYELRQKSSDHVTIYDGLRSSFRTRIESIWFSVMRHRLAVITCDQKVETDNFDMFLQKGFTVNKY